MQLVEEQGDVPELGDIAHLLALRGRSSTPAPPNKNDLRLARVLRIDYASKASRTPPIKIATVVRDAFHEELERYYAVLPLYPSTLVDSVNAGQPQVIIVDREAFYAGVWYGAESSTSGGLIGDLLRLGPWGRKRGARVLFIDSDRKDDVHTEKLRAISSLSFPADDFFRSADGAQRSHYYGLCQKYANKVG